MSEAESTRLLIRDQLKKFRMTYVAREMGYSTSRIYSYIKGYMPFPDEKVEKLMKIIYLK